MSRHAIYCLVINFCCCLSFLDSQAQLLWEVSGNGASSKSYILATNRLVDVAFLDTIPNVFKCYSHCNKVLTEFAMQDYEAIAALRQAAILPDSIKLTNFYTDAEYKEIDAALQLTLGMGMDKLCRMKPSYLCEMYRVELMRKWLDYTEERSMETFFEQVAQQSNIPVYGLDDVGETMYMLFDREPFHWQCRDLKQVIDYPEKEVAQERIIRDLYLWGRLNEIAIRIQSPDNTGSLSYSDYQVYAQRNTQWVKRLKPYLSEGRCFVTLNSIYLGGEKGLISQLRVAGYKVKPVNKALK